MRPFSFLAILAFGCSDDADNVHQLCQIHRQDPVVELTSATAAVDRTCLLPLPCPDGYYEYFDFDSPPHYDCYVSDITHINQPDESSQQLSPCDEAFAVTPCFTVVSDPSCDGEQLAIEVHRQVARSTDVRVLANCTLACEYCCESDDLKTCN